MVSLAQEQHSIMTFGQDEKNKLEKVTKIAKSPQLKLGSLRNFKLKLKIDSNFWKLQIKMGAHKFWKCVGAFFLQVCTFMTLACAFCVWIFWKLPKTNLYLVHLKHLKSTFIFGNNLKIRTFSFSALIPPPFGLFFGTLFYLDLSLIKKSEYNLSKIAAWLELGTA